MSGRVLQTGKGANVRIRVKGRDRVRAKFSQMTTLHNRYNGLFIVSERFIQPALPASP